jgi:hypothetical protein
VRSPVVLHPALLDFHPECVVPVLLVGGCLALARGRTAWFAASVVVACAMKEDVGLTYAVLGLVLAWEGRRRLGAVLAVATGAYSLFAVYVVLPAFGNAPTQEFGPRFAGDRGDSFVDVARYSLLHPLTATQRALDLGDLGILLMLVLTTGGLCLLAPRWLLVAVPAAALNVFSAYDLQHTIDYHTGSSPRARSPAGAVGAGRVGGRPLHVAPLGRLPASPRCSDRSGRAPSRGPPSGAAARIARLSSTRSPATPMSRPDADARPRRRAEARLRPARADGGGTGRDALGASERERPLRAPSTPSTTPCACGLDDVGRRPRAARPSGSARSCGAVTRCCSARSRDDIDRDCPDRRESDPSASRGRRGRLAGHPLLAYAIETARRSEVFDRIVVSTDSRADRKVARWYGADVPFLRPDAFATSTSPYIEWIAWTLPQLEERYDLFGIVRATNPFRGPDVICRGLEQLLATPEADSIRAVERVKQHPGKMWIVDEVAVMRPLPTSPTSTSRGIPASTRRFRPSTCRTALRDRVTRVVEATGTREGKMLAPFSRATRSNIDDEDDFAHAERLIADGRACLVDITREPYPAPS